MHIAINTTPEDKMPFIINKCYMAISNFRNIIFAFFSVNYFRFSGRGISKYNIHSVLQSVKPGYA